MSKLLNTLAVTGMLVGGALAFKGCAEDYQYETNMIQQGKQEQFEEKGDFKDRNNDYEFIVGTLIGLGSLYYGFSERNSKKK